MLKRASSKRPLLAAAIVTLSSLALLGMWALAAAAVASPIILPSPPRVFSTIAGLYAEPKFLEALGATFLRGLASFGLSMAMALPLGIAAGSWPAAKAALAPLLTIVRSVPVLAVILLALILFRADFVPVFSAILMAVPAAEGVVEEGARSIDRGLVEMAAVYRVGPLKRGLWITLPSLRPYIAAASHAALGLCWKVVIAGEVLSMPKAAIGSGMQTARVQLETAEVFAWALAGIGLCALTDLCFGLARSLSGRRHDAI